MTVGLSLGLCTSGSLCEENTSLLPQNHHHRKKQSKEDNDSISLYHLIGIAIYLIFTILMGIAIYLIFTILMGIAIYLIFTILMGIAMYLIFSFVGFATRDLASELLWCHCSHNSSIFLNPASLRVWQDVFIRNQPCLMWAKWPAMPHVGKMTIWWFGKWWWFGKCQSGTQNWVCITVRTYLLPWDW